MNATTDHPLTDPVLEAAQRVLDARQELIDATIRHAQAVRAAERNLAQVRAAVDDPTSTRADDTH